MLYFVQLQVSVDQKHLSEARAGILSILHTIMSSVTLLWSVLYLADSSDRPAGAAAACSSSNINLGSTKVQKKTCVEFIYLQALSIQMFEKSQVIKVYQIRKGCKANYKALEFSLLSPNQKRWKSGKYSQKWLSSKIPTRVQ